MLCMQEPAKSENHLAALAAMASVGSHFMLFLQLVPIFLFLVSSCITISCLATSTNNNSSETDRQALLCLRSHLSDPAGALNSWTNESSSSFCSWHGVSCSSSNHTSHRVVSLDLASLNLSGQISPCIGDLGFIRTIDMASNQISGQIPSEIGQLTRLVFLNLSMNSIGGVIPDSISSCSRLQVIRLLNNSIEGEIPQGLYQLQFLTEITLSNNKLNGTIPSGIGLLPNLQYLFVPNNNLEGNIPEYLGSSSSLYIVNARNNSLTGGIPLVLANCSSLYYLDLMKNNFSGNIPAALLKSTSLVTLELSNNGFSGSIPSSYSVSSSLEYLSFTGNSLSGDIPATLGNFSSLSFLLLAQNSLQGIIPDSLASLPNLLVLDLAYNNLSGIVPPKLYSIVNLTYLGLGVNNLVGRIPSDIGHTLPNIQTLVMEGNNFEGPLPRSLLNASSLQAIEFRDNKLTGQVPAYWSLPNLVQLDLGANLLEGVDWDYSLSTTISTKLEIIYLDHNHIQGILPKSIGTLPRSIQQLYLTDNNFTGDIPSEIGNLTNLQVLQLEGNLFSGGIPDTLGNLGNLFVLNLAGNRLSGGIPQSIGNCQKLSELYLEENSLSGSIPPALAGCQSLVALNLSYNGLQGSIPPEIFSHTSLSKGLDLSYNKLNGSISSSIGDLINLGSLDMSHNQFSGDIPGALGNCLLLESIHLEVNDFSGTIPSSFSGLRGIKEMDLSQNKLSGGIPDFLETFSTLQYLNLSFNNLEGAVPTAGAFRNSSVVFLQGNNKLCANNAMLELPSCTLKSSKRMKTSHVIVIAVVLSCIIVLAACVAIIIFLKRSSPRHHNIQQPKVFKMFSYTELAKATNGFASANLVGSGRFGMIYKGSLKSETHPIAIKVFKLDQVGAPKNFSTECEVLRNTRHRNLIRVISLCSSSDAMGNEFKALILEYMRNGNLEGWLHPKMQEGKYARTLNLGSRIMIVLDIAAAVDYLHNWCTPALVHCDLKPSNVLLDDDMVAHVSDFGLAKFLFNYSAVKLNTSTDIVGPRGTVGYIAPEYGMGCEISTAGDVYSYGIVMLEMLTGKHPTDDMFKNELTIHKLVSSAFPEKISDILDSSLLQCYQGKEANRDSADENKEIVAIQSCIKQLAKLGLKCSVDSPKDRPSIQDVYSEIIAIQEIFSGIDTR